MKFKIIIILCLSFVLTMVGCQHPVIPKPAAIPIPPDAKVVCIFFDDGFLNQYEVALPVLLEYDFKATFGIITDYIGKGRDLMEYMDTGQIEELARLGMDIASHTKTHPDLVTVSDEQLYDEIHNSKTDLQNLGFDVTTLVYPFYEWNEQVIDAAIAANYTCARAGWTEDRIFYLADTHSKARYHAVGWQISNETLDHFKLILNNNQPNAALCLVYHFITDDGPADTSTPVENFKEQMAYLKSAGFTVVPFCDIFRQ
jgi:peptidoglycan/xylan/chitin deacetylase (PgdA/CDA1 family)